jgi:hypothetical protein
MPTTKRRVLHGNEQCEVIFDRLNHCNYAAITIPINARSRCRNLLVDDVDVWALAVSAYRVFYQDTELADCLSSMKIEINAVSRTVILRNIRVTAKKKYLPKVLYDIRVY